MKWWAVKLPCERLIAQLWLQEITVPEHQTLVEAIAADIWPRQPQMRVAPNGKRHLCVAATLGIAMVCILFVFIAAELSNEPELHVQTVGVSIPSFMWIVPLTLRAPAGSTMCPG